MIKYAKINSENIVENVIISTNEDISTIDGNYIEITQETNDPVIGLEYNFEKGKFDQSKPYSSWIQKEDLTWESPVGPKPEGFYSWNEDSKEWIPLS